MSKFEAYEENAVRKLGDKIGYRRLMQLGEEMWRKRLTARKQEGAEHTVGPCSAFLVQCPHPEVDGNGHCEWCRGSGRLTARVAELITIRSSN